MNINLNDIKDKEKVIDAAFELCSKQYKSNEIIDILNSDDDVKKCIAIMNIKEIDSQEYADLLIYHLTNHGGTVREAVAIKLNILFNTEKNIKYFQTENIVNTICDAIIDINPNISRIILEIINKINNKTLILDNIYNKIQTYLNNILQCEVLQNHQVNKYYFKIYWLLEGLYILDNIDIKKFTEQFNTIATLPEYTVREKLALLTKKYNIENIKSKLKKDENYYVRKIFE